LDIEKGCFYFINDDFFNKFSHIEHLMGNNKNGNKRPVFFAFENKTNSDILWVVPISSKVPKYKKIYNKKISKNGICDTIVFGNVLGHEKAFLIQNMCPISKKYIDSTYENQSQAVKVDNLLKKEIIKKSKKVLALDKKGMKLIYPNVLEIENSLLNDE